MLGKRRRFHNVAERDAEISEADGAPFVAKVKADPQAVAFQALARALLDPAPRVLLGTKAKPGVFDSSTAKPAALLCLDRGWLATTGEFVGKGNSRKELYRITPTGIRAVLENSEPVKLLDTAVSSLQEGAGELKAIRGKIDQLSEAFLHHKQLVTALQERLRPPDVAGLLQTSARAGAATAPASDSEWLAEAVRHLEEYQRRHPLGHCALPELFHRVAEPRRLTIGQFHDGVRQLVEHGKVRLHPFTGAGYQLQEEQYALLAGQEIKYYAQLIAHA